MAEILSFYAVEGGYRAVLGDESGQRVTLVLDDGILQNKDIEPLFERALLSQALSMIEQPKQAMRVCGDGSVLVDPEEAKKWTQAKLEINTAEIDKLVETLEASKLDQGLKDALVLLATLVGRMAEAIGCTPTMPAAEASP